MLSVAEALSLLLKDALPLGPERIALSGCAGRIAAADIHARLTQPPFAASAMDGYAVRFDDAKEGARLNVIGEAKAGAPFAGVVGEGQAARIFTGGVVPEGADHIVIQEDVERDGDVVTMREPQPERRHIRPAGIDFREGDLLAGAGARLHETHGALFAAANIAAVDVFRRAQVSVFSNGDELKEPGEALKPGEIVNSNHYAVCALINHWGGEARYLGCARDNENSVAAMFDEAREADVIIPIGGASVGDYDVVKSAFKHVGGKIVFEKVAVRPGKPTWFGRIGGARVVGLPGNPASAIVTATLFAKPLIVALGGGDPAALYEAAPLGAAAPANGARETYLRAVLKADGRLYPADNQDSSLLMPFSEANALIQRPPDAGPLSEGAGVRFLRLR